MRALWLLAVLVLAGCAVEGPSPAPPPPASPSPEAEPFVERYGEWRLEMDGPAITGRFGDVVPFALRLVHPDPPADTFVWLDATWGELDPSPTPLTRQVTLLRGTIVLGQDPSLGFRVGDPEETFHLVGPPLRWSAPAEVLEARVASDVSDDAPGLSIRTSPGRLHITYAAPRNATTTADERVDAPGPFALVHAGERVRVAGFVQRAQTDAVAPLDEPERTRVLVDAEVPPGEVHVRVVTRLFCFCRPQPAVVHDEVVVVPPRR